MRHNPDDIERLYGTEQGDRLNRWVMGSADLVFNLARRHAIDCDATQNGWISPAHRPSRLGVVRAKYEQWAKRGAPVDLLDRQATAALVGSEHYHGAWVHRAGGHIQPLNFARGLATAAIKAGAQVHGKTPATHLTRDAAGWRVATPQGAITADSVILATNAYTDRLWPSLKATVIPVRSFHVATAPLGANVRRSILPMGHGLSDTRQALWAFRFDRDGRLVMTAMPFLTMGVRGGLLRSTLGRLATLFPQLETPEIEHLWDGKVAMTVDRLPHYHALAPGVHAGLGYNGRGIALGTAMGKLMAERALGRISDQALPIPATPLKPLTLHDAIVPLARIMVPVYRWRDKYL